MPQHPQQQQQDTQQNDASALTIAPQPACVGANHGVSVHTATHSTQHAVVPLPVSDACASLPIMSGTYTAQSDDLQTMCTHAYAR